MRGLISILSLAMLLPQAVSWAQIYAPNESGVALGHWHTIVRDVEATKKFWILLGGKPIKVDEADVIKFPGILVFLTKGLPAGGSDGTVVNHGGLRTANGKELMEKLAAAGVKMDPVDPATGRPPNLPKGTRVWNFAYTPDDFRVEILEDRDSIQKNDFTVPTSSDLVHFYLPDVPSIARAQAWYAKVFAAVPTPPVPPARDVNSLIPGAKLNFSLSRTPPLPTKGRALDHIGFEVKNLEAFCKELEASGVKFDQPYSKTRHKSFASAELTDLWGTSIELTEGLDRF